jgi:hypothetical protein
VLCVDEKSQIPGTPDATTTELEVLWIPGGMAILRQDGATRPATYLGPLQSTD